MRLALSSADEILAELAGRARRLRLARNWTQAELAARAGVSVASLRRFETSGHAALEVVVRLAQALQVVDGFEELFVEPAASIAALEREERAAGRQRASRPGRGGS